MTRIRYIEPVDSNLYGQSRTDLMNKISSPNTTIEVCNISLPKELSGPMLPPVPLYLNEIISEVLKATLKLEFPAGLTILTKLV